MRTSELDFDLPAQCIATEPAEPRDAARLMVINRATGVVQHRQVRDLVDLPDGVGPQKGDLMVFNQTRVLPAQFEGTRAKTSGRIGGLYLGSQNERDWLVMLESRGTLREGERIELNQSSQLLLRQRLGSGQWRVELESDLGTLAVLQQVGRTPLPPYIRKARKLLNQPEVRDTDEQRYNTVFARDPGSVAAPTAALHFTPELLARLNDRGIRRTTLTLHIGLGTFAPIRTDDLDQHPMHSEHFCVPAKTIELLQQTRQGGGRIIPVGTTCVRALESLPDPLQASTSDYEADTRLFIKPGEPGRDGFKFRFADGMMTNFHLPCSTLLALVSALPGVGLDQLKAWYREAIANGYRFYSFGDAMWIA